MLLIFGGLPGVGKTAVATGLAREIGAVHLRIDSIEQALRNIRRRDIRARGVCGGLCDCRGQPEAGTHRDRRLREPIVEVTRSAWRSVAQRTGRRYLEIEIICSDQAEHRRRVESRTSDIAGMNGCLRGSRCATAEYEPWEASCRRRHGGSEY